jgi:hypothetical protein
MQIACNTVERMSNIQIRNVPPELHRKLKARAAAQGMSLSDFLLIEVERAMAVPTSEELRERIRRLPRVPHGRPPSAEIRRMRDAAG